MADQLSLFGEPPRDAASRESEGAGAFRDALERHHAEARTVASAVPEGVFFGTSSWSFPGWAGIVYSRARSASELARDGLREYARHPLLTTVGIDRSYYAPLPLADLRAYREQLPSGFRCCIKAPAAVMSYTLGPPRARVEPNPDFLSVERLADDLLEPLAAGLGDRTGPIILECPPFARGARLAADAFLDRLEAFVAELPRDFEYAVELRDPSLLTPRYAGILAAHGIAHTYNYWTGMPMPVVQAATVPPETAAFSVVRLLLKPGTWYEDQRDAFRPFDRLQAPDDAMRRDVVDVTQRALGRQKRVYILVNNKAEGSSPLTVLALARQLSQTR